jgi:DNA polymerase-3 subunit epsilon
MDMELPLIQIYFCALDVETTGSMRNLRLVELGASRFRLDASEPRSFVTLVDPGVPISTASTLIHGITDTMVAGAPRAPEALEGFFRFASGCVLLAHNASFDAAAISMELARHCMEAPELIVLDTLGLARRLLPGPSDHRLATLVSWLGLFTGCAHRALPDAAAAREVFRAAVRGIEGWEDMPLHRLVKLTGAHRFGRYRLEEVELPPGLEAIREALRGEVPVKIIYSGGTRGLAPRTISPRCLYVRRGVAYLEAWCHQSGKVKRYRVDRIIDARY